MNTHLCKSQLDPIGNKRRKNHIEDGKTFLAIMVMSLVVLGAIAFVDHLLNTNAIEKTFLYDKYEVRVNGVRILSPVNVRSEPILVSDADNNSFGRTRGEDVLVPVSTMFKTKEIVDMRNGEFYGFSVLEILEMNEGVYFPDEIIDDPDGIVWIHHSYVNIDQLLPG